MRAANINAITGEITYSEIEVDDPIALAISAAEVKAEARRRLAATDWYVIRAIEDGGAPIPEAVLDYRRAVRIASGAIEALDPIPADYADDSYWPEVVS